MLSDIRVLYWSRILQACMRSTLLTIITSIFAQGIGQPTAPPVSSVPSASSSDVCLGFEMFYNDVTAVLQALVCRNAETRSVFCARGYL
ncbi:hypothetical protein F5Y13DRAFT_166088 [Hypoxylon sp. FL1857]|nr:hypothetical protein F5Y13DRAFT_166088 [Hypoxylon sp. FL1857]